MITNFRARLEEVMDGFQEVLSIKAYTGRLRPKGAPFSGFRYIKG